MAKGVTLKRVITYAWLSFRRNGWLSTATILVMVLTLFVIGGLLLVSVIANTILNDLEQKIDISIAFKKGAPESAILSIRRELEALTRTRLACVGQDRARMPALQRSFMLKGFPVARSSSRKGATAATRSGVTGGRWVPRSRWPSRARPGASWSATSGITRLA